MSKTILVAVWRKKNDDRHLARTSGERLTLLSQALALTRTAAASNRIPKRQNIRAILVVPEYYFAHVGAGKWSDESVDFIPRALPREEKDDILKALAGLSAGYPDILVVPGAIAWKKSLQREVDEVRRGKPTSRTEKTLAEMDLHLRTAYDVALLPPKISPKLRTLMLKNGATQDTLDQPWSVRTALEKNGLPDTAMYATDDLEEKITKLGRGEYDSVMRTTAYVLFNGVVRLKYHKQGDFHEAVGAPRTVFVPGTRAGTEHIAGIHFGFEICLDHDSGALARQLEKSLGRWPQVHIVVSDSTDNDVKNFRARDGGYFIHASTDDDSTKVARNDGGKFKDVTPLHAEDPWMGGWQKKKPRDREKRAGNNDLRFWIITV